MLVRSLATALFLMTGLQTATAHGFQAGPIVITHPWSRPTSAAAPVAGGYMKLSNTGIEPDRLMAISSPFAAKSEIHRSEVVDGVASMRPVRDGLPLAPGAVVDFEADRLHVMFIKPVRALKEGDRVPVTLVFEKAGAVDVEFAVQRGTPAPAMDHSTHGAAN